MSGVYGLVVAGGKSSRMGTDKAFLKYNDKEQIYHIYDMLIDVCGEAYISCNKEQARLIDEKYNVIIDAQEYEDMGPIGGILSAFKRNPNGSFVAIGCDYPTLTKRHIELLYNGLMCKRGISYFNIETEKYEPLLTGYHYNMKFELNKKFRQNNYSLQAVLSYTNVQKIELSDKDIPKSIDDKEAAMKMGLRVN